MTKAPITVASPNMSRHYESSKTATRSKGGIVTAQNRFAAEAGARVLKAGGHAVDAAIAAAMAVGVAEPWMSGIGGVGAMLVYEAKTGKVSALDFGGVSPKGLKLEDFKLIEGKDAELFGWPAVAGDHNVKGAKSVVTPSQPAGVALAHATFGKRPWAELLEPAIALAEEGIVVDWYTTLHVAGALNDLLDDPESRKRFTRNGAPPIVPAPTDPAPILRLPAPSLARTLRTLAREGGKALYSGPLARSIAADIKALGGYLSEDDLAACAPRFVEPLRRRYGAYEVVGLPGLTGGPTMDAAFAGLPAKPAGDDAGLFSAYADALTGAWEKRFAEMGHRGQSHAPTSTTHISVVDREGNMVALTQTLLSVFGARITLPESGIVMNNGINWFDPRPESINGIAAGARVLSNYCPTLLLGEGDTLAIGGCGGRKILPACFQIMALIADRGLSLEEAYKTPRLDVSGGALVVADDRLAPAAIERLAKTYQLLLAPPIALPAPFARTGAVRRLGAENFGMSEECVPWADSISEDEV